MQSILHMTPEGLLELELHDGVLVWPPKECVYSRCPTISAADESKSLLALMIQLVSAVCASLSAKC